MTNPTNDAPATDVEIRLKPYDVFAVSAAIAVTVAIFAVIILVVLS